MNVIMIISRIFGSLCMGALIGLIPFLYAKKRGYDTMGLICMLICMLGSFLAGVFLSVPVCLISVIVIALQKDVKGSANPYQDPYINQNYQNIAPRYTGNLPEQGQNNGQQNRSADGQFIYCPHCKAQLTPKPGTAYCTNCGKKLEQNIFNV